MSHLGSAASSRPNLQQQPASSPLCASLQPQPCVFSAVLLLHISPALVSMPIKHFLSPASLFRYAPASGFTIGLCPVNSENNDSFCLFDWIDPECGSSEFRRAASANLAVLSQSQTLAVCFPSAPTSRVRREWIPAQSVPAKHRYLIERGENTVITLNKEPGTRRPHLTPVTPKVSSSQLLQCLHVICQRVREAETWSTLYIFCDVYSTWKKSIPLLAQTELHSVVMAHERHHSF